MGQVLALKCTGNACASTICSQWFQEYRRKTGIRIRVFPSDMENSIQRLTRHTADFGVLESPLMPSAITTTEETLLRFPAAAYAVAIAYNLPGIKKLRLDGETLAQIFLGKISKWNDSAIQKLNEGVQLPDLNITVAFRSDEYATTALFIHYLRQADFKGTAEIGSSDLIQWPTGVGTKGSGNLAELVSQIPGCISYMELGEALRKRLACALILNKSRKFVEASTRTTTVAVEGKTNNLGPDIINAPGPEAYPLCGLVWLMACQNQTDPEKGKALVDFLNWCLEEGQGMTPAFYDAPLPGSLIEEGKTKIGTMKY